ncbi:MAG: IS200/IS605 family transposase [Candidatus Levybacteria bacterium]|nr:IS200/IS605 family transposase [Candidatus Levybacteria bacterium]
MGVKHTSHARFELWYHLAFSTKYRKKIWTNEETKTNVSELFRTIAINYDMEIDKIEVMSDHVHMSVSAPPRIAPFQVAQILKSVSTRLLFKQYKWLRSQYWGGEIWVQGYFVRSVGPGLTKEQINKYIEEQSEEL